MTKNQLKEQFAIECTTLDDEGYTVVKGTPMDIINWIANKFCLFDGNESSSEQTAKQSNSSIKD